MCLRPSIFKLDERADRASSEKVASVVPYNGRTVASEDREYTLDRSAAEQCAAEAAGLAAELHALDEARSLSGVLHALVDAAQRRADYVALFLVNGPKRRRWRVEGAADGGSRCSLTFPLNVGGRVVAVLHAETAAPDGSAAPMLDILTCHASRVLESMTLHTALGLVPPRVR